MAPRRELQEGRHQVRVQLSDSNRMYTRHDLTQGQTGSQVKLKVTTTISTYLFIFVGDSENAQTQCKETFSRHFMRLSSSEN